MATKSTKKLISDMKKWGEPGIMKQPSKEAVNHPAHYGGADNPYEHIKVLEALGWNYCIGNCTKYLWRAGKKDNTLQDLKKAAWYLNREIERQQKEEDAKKCLIQ